jgi:hypothetical protein
VREEVEHSLSAESALVGSCWSPHQHHTLYKQCRASLTSRFHRNMSLPTFQCVELDEKPPNTVSTPKTSSKRSPRPTQMTRFCIRFTTLSLSIRLYIDRQVVVQHDRKIRKSVRIGHSNLAAEKDSSDLIRAKTSVPVPRVYEYYRSGDFRAYCHGQNAGETLQSVWSTLEPKLLDGPRGGCANSASKARLSPRHSARLEAPHRWHKSPQVSCKSSCLLGRHLLRSARV